MTKILCLITIFAMPVFQGEPRADDKREEKPRFKGVELYSWKDKDGNWLYVLINGTNRQKTENEVKEAKRQIKGTAEIKKAMALLAEGEQVSWSDHRLSGFEFPPEDTRKEIEKAAKEAKVSLTIHFKRERASKTLPTPLHRAAMGSLDFVCFNMTFSFS